MPPIIPFVLFLISVVGVFLLAGNIAFQENNIQEPEKSLITVTFEKADPLLKKVAVWTFVITGAVIFLLLWLHVVAILVTKTGFFFKGLMALVSSVLLYELAGYFTALPWNRGICAFVITAAWLIYPNWITLDIAAIGITLTFLINMKNVTFKSATIISLIIMIYDVVAVFGIGVMQKVASSALGSMPILFIVPQHLTPMSERMFAIGLGDVVLPGIVIMIALREAKKYGYTRIGWLTILGYVSGCILTFWVMITTKTPQPATIYLIPCTFLFLLLGTYGTPVRDKFIQEFTHMPTTSLHQVG